MELVGAHAAPEQLKDWNSIGEHCTVPEEEQNDIEPGPTIVEQDTMVVHCPDQTLAVAVVDVEHNTWIVRRAHLTEAMAASSAAVDAWAFQASPALVVLASDTCLPPELSEEVSFQLSSTRLPISVFL